MFFHKLTTERKIKNLAKRIIHLNFLFKFVGRVTLQPSYKTIRLFTNKKRFKATLWVDWKKEVFDLWALKKNKFLYSESQNFLLNFTKERKKIIKNFPISGSINKSSGGGGGNEALLYFLVKMISAQKVLETGVAAGSSSRSLLEAMDTIGSGKLYSSDLAMLLDKEKVGILVSEKYRKNWFLAKKGDKENLPKIFKIENFFDLIYYDSDKSYSSKKWFHSVIIKNPLPKILIYDDIDRDHFFSECVRFFKYKYKVFGNAGIIFFDEKYF
jgi:predicted O-methyltransferase YrrM